DLLRLQSTVGSEVHHHFSENDAQTALLGRFETDLAAVFVDGRINHRRCRAVPCQLVKKERCLPARPRTGKLALDRENIFSQPGEKLALATGHGRILRQVGVAVDQPGKNGSGLALDPMQPRSAWPFPQIIVSADFGDLAVSNDYGAVAVAAERTVSRRVDKISPDSERVGRHSGMSLASARAISAEK